MQDTLFKRMEPQRSTLTAPSVDTMTYTEWLTLFRTEDFTGTITTTRADDMIRIHLLTCGFCLILLSTIGVLGNGLVIVSVIITKKLHTPTNILVANLAFADLLSCTLYPPYALGTIFMVISESDELPLPFTVTEIIFNVIFTCLLASSLILCSIAFIRWYVITKSIRGHQGLHTPRKVVIISVSIWTFSLAMCALVLSPRIGLVRIAYDPNNLIIHVPDPSIWFKLWVIALAGIGLSSIVIFYGLTLRFVLRHNRLMRAKYQVDSTKPRRNSHGNIKEIMLRREIKITKNLFLVVCFFIIAWFPFCSSLLFPENRVFYLYSILLCFSNNVVNPIFYGLRHPNFREVFKNILCCSSEPLKAIDV